MQLEQIMQIKGIQIPLDEEGADRPHQHLNHNGYNNDGESADMARKYTPFEQFHLGDEDNDDVPL